MSPRTEQWMFESGTFKRRSRTRGGGGTTTGPRAYIKPFAATSPFKTAISTTASFEGPTATITKSLLDRAGNPPPSGNPGTGSGQVNGGRASDGSLSNSYSVTMSIAHSTDPTFTITNSGSGPASVSIKIDPTMEPPDGTDMNTVLVGSDGVTAYEFYRLAWNAGRTALTCTRIIGPYNLITHDGLTNGIRAAGLKLPCGLIRAEEIAAVLAGEADDFGHAIAMSIPKEHLKSTVPMYVPPAVTMDNQANVPYSGDIPMGALFAIPSSANAAAAVTGLLQKALANTLTRYGVYVTDQSTTWALYVDQDVSNANAQTIKTVWRATLMGMLRYCTNNTAANGYGGGPAPRLVATQPEPVGG